MTTTQSSQEASHTICHLCETAVAEVAKFETDSSYDEQSHEVIVKFEILICLECEGNYYDGTETYPGTHPMG